MGKSLIYEIVNPSDYYTLVADDLEVATVAVSLLGEGKYALQPEVLDVPGVPFFLTGGQDSWCHTQFGLTFEALVNEVMAHKREKLIACLESALIGHRSEYTRRLSEVKTEEYRADFPRVWHEAHRRSMNNIGARAWAYARAIRKQGESA